jgi:hypothetical protein
MKTLNQIYKEYIEPANAQSEGEKINFATWYGAEKARYANKPRQHEFLFWVNQRYARWGATAYNNSIGDDLKKAIGDTKEAASTAFLSSLTASNETDQPEDKTEKKPIPWKSIIIVSVIAVSIVVISIVIYKKVKK